MLVALRLDFAPKFGIQRYTQLSRTPILHEHGHAPGTRIVQRIMIFRIFDPMFSIP